MSTGKHTKHDGSFYTPKLVANIMCGMSGLLEFARRNVDAPVRICDPACGDGALLTVIARTLFLCGWTPDTIVESVYGCELDANEARKTRENLSQTMSEHGVDIPPDAWHVVAFDALHAFEPAVASDGSRTTQSGLPARYDYVIGNPPYIRIHSLSDIPSSRWIVGMCDMYYAFYELGMDILECDGTLCYIAPSSWFTAKAGINMRRDLEKNKNVFALLDFEHHQLFDAALTYTAIVAMTKQGGNETISIYDPMFENGILTGALPEKKVPQSSCWVNGMFVPGASAKTAEILSFVPSDDSAHIAVRNGYATNLDSFFISPEDFDLDKNDGLVIDVVKASTAEQSKAIYPYDRDGNVVQLDVIEKEHPALYAHYLAHEDELLARNKVPEGKWQGYARTQGIADTYHDKVAVQSLTNDGSLKTKAAPAGVGVYGGIYVLGMDEKELQDAISSDEFFPYVKALRKYKQGGYYAFGGKDLERFLRWHYEHGKQQDVAPGD